jgi:hypothetical protein
VESRSFLYLKFGCGPQLAPRPTGDVRSLETSPAEPTVIGAGCYHVQGLRAGVGPPARRTSNSSVSAPRADAGPRHRTPAGLNVLLHRSELRLQFLQALHEA